MEPIVAILAVFGMPVAIVFVVKYFRLREKQLELMNAQNPAKLEAVEKERRLLEERVQNLESIVCSVDFELNQRLNRLAAGVSTAARALPPGGSPWDKPPAGLIPSDTTPMPSRPAAAGAPATEDATAPEPAMSYRFGHLQAGQMVLNRYKVERELGHGGMGAVYLAHDAKLGERVALKVISCVSSDDPVNMTARFRREVSAARKVTHPNVIRIHDLGEDGPLLFLSMEYIEGETLAALIRRQGPLPLGTGTKILGDVALGVAAAHDVHIVHRDLKPQNVLLGTSGSVKVIDFGLATNATFLAGMTATGMILGTPEYMAPEQLRGSQCDARTDVYALGAMAYHVFCGRPPFGGETPIAIGFAHLNEEPRPPRQLRPDLPAPVENAILRALAKEPARRFADAAGFRAAIVGG